MDEQRSHVTPAHVPAHLPAHLRRFVVEQDYAQYNAVDRAVWRFLLLQVHARLVDTAHPAYREGLAATGISPERIPSIAEMNDKLSRFGWGAVCVDGFIPPRAFQEFQAHGILPIAADIRSREHLVYTPAPDIFHEAAGHAPILPDPVFAAYLRRIGELGRKAFTLPEEDRLDQAIHALSEKKEDPSLAPEEVARAEAELNAIVASLPEPSEAARLSRLYWWTVEYGLVGRVDDYKIYGAGLLSSLGESHSCHDPSVVKRPLTVECTDVAYDITRPQPQLFVAASFDALHEILDRAARDLAASVGGQVALERALHSREIASVQFSSGASVIGVLGQMGAGAGLFRESCPESCAWLSFEGRVAFAWDGTIQPALQGLQRLHRPDGHLLLTGRLADGSALDQLTDTAIDRARDQTTGLTEFRFASGASATGRLERRIRHDDGRLMALELSGARLSLPGSPPRPPSDFAGYVLVSAGDPVSAHAGAIDPSYHPDTAFSTVSVPKPREFPARDRELLKLYQRAERAHHRGALAMKNEFPEVHAALGRDYAQEWLLRWNLLESLQRARDDGPLARSLRAELQRLEVELDYKQPIASGLAYLSSAGA
jgi:phenylalanine-4-hydroxylase